MNIHNQANLKNTNITQTFEYMGNSGTICKSSKGPIKTMLWINKLIKPPASLFSP